MFITGSHRLENLASIDVKVLSCRPAVIVVDTLHKLWQYYSHFPVCQTPAQASCFGGRKIGNCSFTRSGTVLDAR